MSFYLDVGDKLPLKLFQSVGILFGLHLFDSQGFIIVFTHIDLPSTSASYHLVQIQLTEVNHYLLVFHDQFF